MKNQKKTIYQPLDIETKWQTIWESDNTYSPDLDEPKKSFYNLMMFPYPSAEGLHVGNMYAFTGADVHGRFVRMQGFQVFEPIGLDGFGIHSENYALKVGTHPYDQAQKAQKNFYRQFKMTGNGYDWNHTLETYDPSYYKWTQWLFVEMFKHGLAYRKAAQVNWCPSCKTVLSDEQVIAGECERCGSAVEKRNLEQWFFRITNYAQKLLDNLDKLDWTERVKTAQHNWIGRSEGAIIKFPVNSGQSSKNGQKSDELLKDGKSYIDVFTTRPDTLFGATFLVVSPEHPIVNEIKNPEYGISPETVKKVQEYVRQARKKTEQERTAEGREKTGVFSGLSVINPMTKQKLPVWIADYVLLGYGTGAIMAVPAHDQRDFEFAKKYDLPIKHVVMFSSVDTENPPQKGMESTQRDVIIGIVRNPKNGKYLALKWQQQPWTTFVTGGVEEGEGVVEAARREIAEETGYRDLQLVRVLGGPTEAFFYAQHKGVNRQTKAYSVLFELESEKKDTVAAEERELYSLEWLTLDEIQKDQHLRHVEFPLILEWITSGSDVYTGPGVLINSGDWDGWNVPQDTWKVIDWLEEAGIGRREVNYHLRDWLISRQRYWGAPIPMIYCEKCAKEGKSWFTVLQAKQDQRSKIKDQKEDWAVGWFPVPDDQLPVELPYIKDFKPLGTGKAPLANHPEFYETTCPYCGGPARRETDVSDTFLDSAWYFLRYLATDWNDIPFPSVSLAQSEKLKAKNEGKIGNWKLKIENSERRSAWLPVDIYIGGAEHSVLHLLYARFVTMALKDFGYIDFEEPFTRFFAHGLIIKESAKMSKSKGNVIVPDEYIGKYGADTLRMYLMFLGPFSQGGDFRDTGIEGMFRFVRRVWHLFNTLKFTEQDDQEVLTGLHKTIKAVTEDVRDLSYNTAIARLMEFYNLVSSKEGMTKQSAESYLKLFAPLAPHLTEELYHTVFGHPEKESIHHSNWPAYEEKYLVSDQVTIVIQVNGKRRAEIVLTQDEAGNEELVKEKAQEKVFKYLDGQNIVKSIYIRNKILNFVVKPL